MHHYAGTMLSEWCRYKTYVYLIITIVIHSGHSNLITCLTSFFWKKNPVRLQKKRKKVTFGVLWTKVVLKFSVRLKEKKSASFKKIL